VTQSVSSSNESCFIGTSISLLLLIVTLLVLWQLQQFKSNHGKCLICHIISLILLYIFLILDRMDILIMKIPWLCEISGYMMYLSILFCIFWLNVMCFDIWSTFKSVRNPQFSSGREKFKFYLLYGFGLPILITMMLAVIDETSLFPEMWRPQIGKFECFLRNDRDIEFFYLYLPMSLILIVNVILYSITAFKISSAQNDILVLRGKVSNSRVVTTNPIRMRFFLYLRLFLLMGESTMALVPMIL
jgi:G protein-coupled receptor Mth (Methuselah protein)